MAGPSEPLAKRATELLLAVRDGSVEAANQYDALLFAFLKNTAMRRGRFMAADAAAQLAMAGTSADVQRSDLEEVATIAALSALSRARASALRFDPRRGDGATWALGALRFAYLDAERKVTGSRSFGREVPTEDAVLHARMKFNQADPAVQVEARDALQRALASLTDDERFVVLAKVQHGMAYSEIATLRFGDESQTKLVDRLLQSARHKLAEAQAAWVAAS